MTEEYEGQHQAETARKDEIKHDLQMLEPSLGSLLIALKFLRTSR